MKFFYITVCSLCISIFMLMQSVFAMHYGNKENNCIKSNIVTKRVNRFHLRDIDQNLKKKQCNTSCPASFEQFTPKNNKGMIDFLSVANNMLAIQEGGIHVFLESIPDCSSSILSAMLWIIANSTEYNLEKAKNYIKNNNMIKAKDLWEWISDGVFIYPDRVADGMIEWLSETIMKDDPEFFKKNILDVIVSQGWSSCLPESCLKDKFNICSNVNDAMKEDSIAFFTNADKVGIIGFADQINNYSQEAFDMLCALSLAMGDAVKLDAKQSSTIKANLKLAKFYVREDIGDFYDIYARISNLNKKERSSKK